MWREYLRQYRGSSANKTLGLPFMLLTLYGNALYTRRINFHPIILRIRCTKWNAKKIVGLAYVGKTIRNVGERMKEHASSIRLKQPEKSSLAKHCVDNNHLPQTDQPIILASASNEMELLTKEAIFLQTLPDLINAQEGHQFTNLRLYSRSLQKFRPRVGRPNRSGLAYPGQGVSNVV